VDKNQAIKLWKYISGSIEQLLKCLDGLSSSDLNWCPIESANSLYVLATHVLGNVEENIIETLYGQKVKRNREGEFRASGDSIDPILSKWSDLQGRVNDCIKNLSSENLTRIRKHPRRGEIAGWEILIIVARHAAEHMGQAKLTRDLLFASQGKPLPMCKY
jgi:uncharacterized damage-inducible protein DinB